MVINYPGTCTTEASKGAFCLRFQEKVRIVHNEMGAWNDEGVTEEAYNQFHTKIKNRYPYTFKLSDTDYKDFKDNLFEPVSDLLNKEIGKHRQAMLVSDYWSPDLDGDLS